MSWLNNILGTIMCLTISFIVVGLPTIIIYRSVVVKPRDPTFTLDYASVTGFNLTSKSRLTSFFEVVIRANNPNHIMKLKYKNIRVSILKDKQKLARDTFPGFTQRKKNVTMIRAQPVALNVTLKKGPAFDFEFESGIGYLDFDVMMTASLNGRYLEVNCVNVVVNLTAPAVAAANSSPSADGGSKFRRIGCSVYIYTGD